MSADVAAGKPFKLGEAAGWQPVWLHPGEKVPYATPDTAGSCSLSLSLSLQFNRKLYCDISWQMCSAYTRFL